MIVSIVVFVCAFEFAQGPITWLYMSEIMQDKSLTIATVLNWTMNLLVSYFTKDLVDWVGDDRVGWLFIGAAGFTTIGTFIIAIFMKETKGKTPAQIEAMFYEDKELTDNKIGNNIFDDDHSPRGRQASLK